MLKKLLAVAALCLGGVLAMTGCVSKDAIKVREIEDISVNMRGGIKVNAVVKVENSSGSNIKVKDVLLHVTDLQGNNIGDLLVEQELLIPRRSTTGIIVPIKVRLDDYMAGMGMARDLSSAAKNLLVSGSARVKSGIFGKKITLNNVPLSEIIAILGLPEVITDPLIN